MLASSRKRPVFTIIASECPEANILPMDIHDIIRGASPEQESRTIMENTPYDGPSLWGAGTDIGLWDVDISFSSLAVKFRTGAGAVVQWERGNGSLVKSNVARYQ